MSGVRNAEGRDREEWRSTSTRSCGGNRSKRPVKSQRKRRTLQGVPEQYV